ncbi:hypothetical protein C5167_047944 [Papaver somniferum]|uniref:Transcription initiation factor TFIID subunit 10 n=1 Tax=Papaver somniferum TaxID=3469 RepID=A0A4Y7KGG5_PAPSO|nr:hypothetical protein C5167_047944 [Papaver somniferum]
MNNQNQNQQNHNQSSEVRHDDDAALSDFLASLMDYTPTIPDELVEHYVAKSGFQCPDVRLIRLVAVATQKFIAEVATDALQHSKARQSAVVKDKKQQKDKRLTLTMDDLSKSLRECLRYPHLSALWKILPLRPVKVMNENIKVYITTYVWSQYEAPRVFCRQPLYWDRIYFKGGMSLELSDLIP